MRLKDLLPYLSENNNVNLWYGGNLVEYYNGRDSLTGKYDNYAVGVVKANNCVPDTIDIYII